MQTPHIRTRNYKVKAKNKLEVVTQLLQELYRQSDGQGLSRLLVLKANKED